MSVNRRTLVRGVAWTAPVVAVASAAPAFAASIFDCKGTKWCKTQNRQDSSRWDFKVWPECLNGVASYVLINGQAATYVAATRNAPAYWVLRRQPHAWTFSVKVYDASGRLGFDRVVDVRDSSCGG